MNPEQLAAIKARADAASFRELHAFEDTDEVPLPSGVVHSIGVSKAREGIVCEMKARGVRGVYSPDQTNADADAIVSAVNAVPALLAHAEAETARAEEAEAARDEARKFGEDAARQHNERLASERVLRCALCDHEYAEGTPASRHDSLTAHVHECRNHPLRARAEKAEAEVKRLRALVRDVETALASGRGLAKESDTTEERSTYALKLLNGSQPSALIAAAERDAEAEWRPIETAPKDERILAYAECPQKGPEIETCRWWDFDGGGWFGWGAATPPTHWRPLPEPPAEERGT